MPIKSNPHETLCFTCENAVPSKCRGCEWSRTSQPVPGWTAIPTTPMGMPSFCVIECPKYLQEKSAEQREREFQEQVIKEKVKATIAKCKTTQPKRNTFQYYIP